MTRRPPIARPPNLRMLVPLRRSLAFALVALAATVGAANAAAAPLHTQSASASGITATFTFRGSAPEVTGANLQISLGGQSLYDAPVTSKACGTLCGPGEIGTRNADSVGIVPLLSGSPQVVLELYSGGANCCFIDQIFSLDPGTMTYVKTEHDFLDAGAVLKRINGQYRFVSRDGGFKYAFTDGADSGEPLQIWQFTTLGFVDVTRHYPGLLRKDAAFWLRIFNRHIANGIGLIAAWAGDEELLGRDKQVQATLKRELAKGDLQGPPGGVDPGGAKFIRELNRTLVKLGYKR